MSVAQPLVTEVAEHGLAVDTYQLGSQIVTNIYVPIGSPPTEDEQPCATLWALFAAAREGLLVVHTRHVAEVRAGKYRL